MSFYFEVEANLKTQFPDLNFTKILTKLRQNAGPTFLESVQNSDIINPDGLLQNRYKEDSIPSIDQFANQLVAVLHSLLNRIFSKFFGKKD